MTMIQISIYEEYLEYKVQQCLDEHLQGNHMKVREIVDALIRQMKVTAEVEVFHLYFSGISSIIETIVYRNQVCQGKEIVGHFTQMLAQQRQELAENNTFKGI